MTWRHAIDALIFVAGMLTAFGVAVWVENQSAHYARGFEQRLRNWDHRAYAFDKHCCEAGVLDRRSLLPGRWAA